jgi:hypothetical protein
MHHRSAPVTLPRTFGWTRTIGLLTGVCLTLFCVSEPACGQADSEESRSIQSGQIFPDTTVFYVSVPSFKAMSDAFGRTDFGKMFSDPALKPFLKDLRGQLEEKFADEIQRSGLTLENLQQVDSGEAAFATIVYSEGNNARSGSAFLIQVGQDEAFGQRLQDQIEANLRTRQAKKMPDVDLGGVQVKYYEPKRDGGEIRKPRVFFVHTASWVIVTNRQPVMEMLLESINNGGAAQPLSESPDFQFVRERLDATELPETPQLSWFAAPFELAKVIRDEQVTPGKTSRYLMAMEKTGFDVIKGVGGDFSFDVHGDEYFFQAFVAVPGEGTLMERLRESSRLLSFAAPEGAGDLSPGPWVRDTAADVLTWYWDSGAAFRAAEPLVDQLYDEGTFQRVVNDIRNAESTQVDLPALASSLGPRWTYASEVVPPLNGASEKLLLAIELRDPEIAKVNFRNYLQADWYRLRDAESIGGLELWEFEGEPEGDGDIISILDPDGDDSEDEEAEEEGLLMGMRSFCFPAGQNYVLASNDPDYLVEVLESQRGLTDLPAYGALREKLQPFLKGAPSFYSFALQDRVHELSYQLLRQGTLPESETRLESTLRMILGTENGVVREQEIDGATMPEDYDAVVAPYLGPSGWLVTAEDHGWMIVGAGLKSPSSDE